MTTDQQLFVLRLWCGMLTFAMLGVTVLALVGARW